MNTIYYLANVLWTCAKLTIPICVHVSVLTKPELWILNFLKWITSGGNCLHVCYLSLYHFGILSQINCRPIDLFVFYGPVPADRWAQTAWLQARPLPKIRGTRIKVTQRSAPITSLTLAIDLEREACSLLRSMFWRFVCVLFVFIFTLIGLGAENT